MPMASLNRHVKIIIESILGAIRVRALYPLKIASPMRSSRGENPFRELFTHRGRRQRCPVLLHDVDPFVDDLTQLGINLRLVIAMAAWTDDARALADKAAIVIGPFDDLDVAGTLFHPTFRTHQT
jgi:hypothetical protein